jgi:hypothetical protein
MVSMVNMSAARFLLLQAPQEQLLQHPAEGDGMKHAEGAEEALHGMRGGHLPAWHLHHGGVAFLSLQVVEITQVPAGAIEEKVQGPAKTDCPTNPLGTFLEASELVQQQGHDAYGLHLPPGSPDLSLNGLEWLAGGSILVIFAVKNRSSWV